MIDTGKTANKKILTLTSRGRADIVVGRNESTNARRSSISVHMQIAMISKVGLFECVLFKFPSGETH